ncbi:MAG: hydantoinase/oxoprolinase family protein [Clostridiales Family XIII bacterium]|jgi:N-methylhydantoinase A|nr:hydantoinase/oxoprolinase family protein [Clostridiales Family XIII bacterium]
MSKYACVDVGGTFTDAAILETSGDIRVFKAPTTPGDWTEGIINSLKIAAGHYNQTLAEFLGDISVSGGGFATHGSTIATNAIVEKKVGKIGVLCTKGFRDVFLFREGPNKNPFDMDLDYPEPFVPRYRTLPVEERINSEGGIETPLNEDDVRAGIKTLREYQVEAICVCYLWSTANEAHERRTAEIIRQEWPDVGVVLSCEVNPSSREYRRWVSAAIDASLRRLISTYATNLNERLAELGFKGKIGMLNASGGVMSAEEIVSKPLYTIDSGPAMAPVAGRNYAIGDVNDQNAVVLDMGGTTFDVSCVIKGHISVSREAVIGDEIPGISRVSVHSIGAGGGSIAWVDSGGMIRVGPTSAGSVPGPACYGRGGELPTVTDANLVLGYLNPDFFNDGMMKLSPERSTKAIREHIADKLNISVVEAAFAIWATVNVNMIAAIKDITIWQGIDPRSYTMVAGGGACGLHAIPLAEGLEMSRLLIPRTAGGLSAVGGIFTDTVSEYNSSCLANTRDFDHEKVNKVLKSLADKAMDFFERNNIAEPDRRVELYMEGHYPFQVWDLSVDITPFVDKDFKLDQDSVKLVEAAFHEEHERTFTIKEDANVECVYWRVKAIGANHVAGMIPEQEYHSENLIVSPAKRTGSRKIYFKKYNEAIVTPVFSGDNLVYGDVIQGPAIVEEPTTTIVVLPDYSIKVTKYNNYLIEGLKTRASEQ